MKQQDVLIQYDTTDWKESLLFLTKENVTQFMFKWNKLNSMGLKSKVLMQLGNELSEEPVLILNKSSETW